MEGKAHNGENVVLDGNLCMIRTFGNVWVYTHQIKVPPHV